MGAIHIAFVIAACLQAAIWARELILGLVHHRVGGAEEGSTLGSAIGIIRLLVTVALFAIAIILILDNLGVNVTGLVAGLGIGGIAIGLAAQGIFSDLFAALSIIFDKPFRKGDVISFGSPPTTGIVEHIGLKSTRVRSLGGEEVVMANTKLLEQQLQNWALVGRRRAVMAFGVVYQTPADLLERQFLRLHQVDDCARIQRAATRPHHQAVERREPHRRAHAAQVLHGTEACAAAQVRRDAASALQARRHLGAAGRRCVEDRAEGRENQCSGYDQSHTTP